MTELNVFYARIDFDKKSLTRLLDDETITHLEISIALPRRNFKDVAKLIAKTSRPHIQHLALIDANFIPDGDVGRAMVSGKAEASFWAALPNLTALTLTGHALFATIEHDALTDLTMRGYCFGTKGSFFKKPAKCPNLQRLRWSFTKTLLVDELGVAALSELWDADFTGNLTELDLGRVELGGSLFNSPRFMKSDLLKQLDKLVLPIGNVPPDDLEKALPKLAHLSEIIVDHDALLVDDPRVRLGTPSDYAPKPHPEHVIAPWGIGGGKITRLALDQADTLTTLRLPWNWLDEVSARELAEQLAAHPELESLDLAKPATYGVTAASLEVFARALGKHAGLKHLNFEGNRLTGAGAALARLLDGLSSLESLDLTHTSLTGADVSAIVPALNRLEDLKAIHIGASEAPEGSTAALALASAAKLEELVVWGVDLSEPTFTHGFTARFPSLRHLRIGLLNRDTTTSSRFLEELSGHPTLTHLSLTIKSNERGIYTALGDFLANTSITALSIYEDFVDGDSNQDELHALARTETLESLTFRQRRGELPPSRATAWVEAITQIPTLTSLSGFNPDTSTLDDGPAFLKELGVQLASKSNVRSCHNTDIYIHAKMLNLEAAHEVEIDMKRYSKGWLDVLTPILCRCESLHTLRFTKAEMTKETARWIHSIVAANPHIKTLELDLGYSAHAAVAFVAGLEKLGTVEEVALDIEARGHRAAITEWLDNTPALPRARFI